MTEARCYLCKFADEIVERKSNGRRFFIRCGRDKTLHEPCSFCADYDENLDADEEVSDFLFTRITEGGLR